MPLDPVDPAALLEEIEALESRGVSTDKLFVSDRAHVIMPYHPIIDQLDEKLRGEHAKGWAGCLSRLARKFKK